MQRRNLRFAPSTPNVIFAGRLGTYRNYNMDEAVGQELSIWRRLQAAEQEGTGVITAT